ncbi:glycosyltransferase family 2 protein [Candidatus Bathycorpusculum sp.]|jgi:dolichol-phosphate mannosyltransferase|uniref:glycosyltransferase family 2 protein n=1 Tax=Candidatus Bathycorpusculum sp. TaxID=2994959 RepID=UPI002818C475|nr:glycosyltransferase family 2 protein [Candidatus Termitimicrobium sp.]MCL2686331.1 glycosyltransferase family 2 protein [Candidatus Termitimicrobium sp.]
MTTKVELVSVVIPTLNEAGNILEAIETIQKSLIYPNEIIIVDGNSTDGTKEIVKSLGYCRLIVEPRRGYGLALLTGMKNAKGNIIIMVDGDGTYEVRHINRMIAKMVETDADMVLATRMYDPNKAMGLMNFIGNKVITFVYDFVYRQFLSDTQSGFRAISHEAIDKVELKEGDMAFATEMLIQFAKEGFSMVEVPTTYKIRRYGKPKLRRFKSGIEIFSTIFKGVLDAETIRNQKRFG